MLAKLRKQHKRNVTSRGFTIIEVMIVLAIAGLILLIVFLAVPALQRSSRNTQRKSDVGRVGAGIQSVVSDNNGATLTAANFQTALRNEIGNLSYYTSADINVLAGVAGPANTTTTNDVNVYMSSTCAALAAPAVGEGATTTGAQATQFAITYSTETGSGQAYDCNDE